MVEDDLRIMLDFMNMVNAFGTDPILSDILTEENSRQVAYLKDCISYLSDVDFDLLQDDTIFEEDYDHIMSFLKRSEEWSQEFIRGIILGILTGIDTDSSNPMGFKHEMASLYRLLNAILIEGRVK
jgi:hypothetical protein